MKRYSLYYTKEAKKALKKLDKPVLVMIKAWVEKNLVNTVEPGKYGETIKRANSLVTGVTGWETIASLLKFGTAN